MMAAAAAVAPRCCTRVVRSLRYAFNVFDRAIQELLGDRSQPDLCLATVTHGLSGQREQGPALSVEEIWGKDGFLWAVPKSRRSIEKRLKRRYGDHQYVWKMLVPKSNLQVCNTCGDDHEIGVLCPTCYKKVIEETRQMQEKIENELKLKPIEQEVVVMYEGENDSTPTEFYKGKRIVEMGKPRPAWFSKNLLQKTTQQPSNATDVVKPSDLG